MPLFIFHACNNGLERSSRFTIVRWTIHNNDLGDNLVGFRERLSVSLLMKFLWKPQKTSKTWKSVFVDRRTFSHNNTKSKPQTHEHNPPLRTRPLRIPSPKWMLRESRSWRCWPPWEIYERDRSYWLYSLPPTYLCDDGISHHSSASSLYMHVYWRPVDWVGESRREQSFSMVAISICGWDDRRQDSHSAGIGKEYTPKYERTSLMACPFLWHPIVTSFSVRRVRSHIAVQSRFFLQLGSTITWAIG